MIQMAASAHPVATPFEATGAANGSVRPGLLIATTAVCVRERYARRRTTATRHAVDDRPMHRQTASLATAAEWLVTCGAAAAALFVLLILVESAASGLRCLSRRRMGQQRPLGAHGRCHLCRSWSWRACAWPSSTRRGSVTRLLPSCVCLAKTVGRCCS